jgi:pentatricopeptide repeat protein
MLFGSMSGKYDITPRVEHHTCMVMVLGSAGQFDKALSIIEMMPCTSYPAVWLALLAACKKWEKVRLAMVAFDQAVQEAADENAAAYVLMCSIFSAAGMYIDAGALEECRLKHASCKGGGVAGG